MSKQTSITAGLAVAFINEVRVAPQAPEPQRADAAICLDQLLADPTVVAGIACTLVPVGLTDGAAEATQAVTRVAIYLINTTTC